MLYLLMYKRCATGNERGKMICCQAKKYLYFEAYWKVKSLFEKLVFTFVCHWNNVLP